MPVSPAGAIWHMRGDICLGVFQLIRLLALSVACLPFFAGSALAADLLIPADDVAAVSDGFDWARPYIGAQVVGEFSLDDGSDYFGGGVFAGVNFLASDNVVLGIEGTADLVSNGDYTYAELFVLGRAGLLVTPDVLFYGIGGVGYEFDIDDPEDGSTAYQLGAGIEFAVADDVTLRGQLTGYGNFEDDELFDYARATVGVAFHF